MCVLRPIKMLITTGKVKILKKMQKELLKKQEILQEYAQN